MSGGSEEKTEQPTKKKLRDLRKKGQIAKSKDLVIAFNMIAAFLYLWLGWDIIKIKIHEMMTLPSQYYGEPFDEAFPQVVAGVILKAMGVIFPLVALVVVLVILAHFFQFGVLFSIHPIIPNMSRIHPVEGFKKLFSLNKLVDLIKSILKVAAMMAAIYVIVRNCLGQMVFIPYWGIDAAMGMLASMLKQTVIATIIIFIVFAAFDLFMQKFLFKRQNRMSKYEVKKEYKNREGDPFIKGKRKALHKEFALTSAKKNIQKSNVVITNPTHLAVALFYNKLEVELPVVTAKGKGGAAKYIVKEAKKAGVPVVQNKPLARKLFSQVPIEEYIPKELLFPVAEILRWVRDKREWK
ncbi:MAG: type III secretion system export apparatus subunit SctU [Desulfobacteraceae bacterium]|jgi:type III secretion protein U